LSPVSGGNEMKKIILWILGVCAVVLLAACPGPAGRPSYEFWERPGASQLEINKAMLECGYQSLSFENEPLNEGILTRRCMQKSGFRSKSSYSFCRETSSSDIPPACFLPEDQIPERSVERRVNGKQCTG
jgi:hypothetical protein